MQSDILDKHMHRVAKFIERTTMKRIFIVWFVMVLSFGGLYFCLSLARPQDILDLRNPLPSNWHGLSTAMYFSIITATTAGYGDVLPVGFARIFASMEVVLGFIIMGVFISKLVSAKQDMILEELYRISFDEKINRIRSAFYLLRGDCTKLSEELSIGRVHPEDLRRLSIILTTFDTLLADTTRLVCKNRNLREIDPLRLELLLNSIDLSLSKLIALLKTAASRTPEWKSDKAAERIDSILQHVSTLTEYQELRTLSQKTKEKVTVTEDLADKLAEFR